MTRWAQYSLYCVSVLLLAGGAAIPSDTLLFYLRGDGGQALSSRERELLLWGTYLFRGCLCVVGFLLLLWTRWIDGECPRVLGAGDPPVPPPRYGTLLVVLLLVGLGLRLYGLGLGLWYDEITAYVKYVRMPVGEILTTFDSENQHMFYTLLAHGCVGLFGDSGWAVRLPAVGFGVGSLWGVYLLGRHLFSEREALLGTALLTFSYHHIWFSQNARGYTGLMFFAVLASWAFLLAWKTRRRKWWTIYALMVALGNFTHLTMIFVVTAHVVMYLMMRWSSGDFSDRRTWIESLWGFGLGGLLTVQCYALVLPQILDTIGQTTRVQAWNNPLWTVLELLRGLQLGVTGGLLALGAGVIVVGWGGWILLKENPMAIGFFALPAILGSALVIGMGHPLWPRFFFFLAGFSALILVRAIMIFGEKLVALWSEKRALGANIGVGICVGFIGLSAVTAHGAYAPKQDFEGAIVYVENHRGPKDIVVTAGLAKFPYKKFFQTDWVVAEDLKTLNGIRSHANRTWLVVTMPIHLEAYHPGIARVSESEFELVKKFPGTLGNGTVYIYRASDMPPSHKVVSDNSDPQREQTSAVGDPFAT